MTMDRFFVASWLIKSWHTNTDTRLVMTIWTMPSKFVDSFAAFVRFFWWRDIEGSFRIMDGLFKIAHFCISRR